jgi:hypothetical protein
MGFWSTAKGFLDGMIFTIFKREFSWTGYTVPNKWEFFTNEETKGLKDDFMRKVVAARRKTIDLDPDHKGIPFRVSSGYRSPGENKSVIGAVPDSSHIKGLALDCRVYSSREVSIIIQACYACGIDRIGVYVDSNWQPTHLHMDCDPEKSSDVFFVKQEQN